MIKDIIKYAKFFRVADAFSTLNRGNYLNNQIESNGLFNKFNLSVGKQKNELAFFIGDVIDNIIYSYISKNRSDYYQWFLDNFKKQSKHLQDIINCDNIVKQDFLNRKKGTTIDDFQRFKNELGSCVNILDKLRSFDQINKQLPKEFKKKISELTFESLISC